MQILDRYVLRRFIVSLIFAIVFFVVIVICVDMVGNLARFIDKEVPAFVVVKYYLYYVPFIVNSLGLPMAMLLASMLSIGQMAKHNELAAIKSAGISMNRMFVGVLAFSLLISAAALIFAEKVVPATNQGKTQIEQKYLGLNKTNTSTTVTNMLLRDSLERRVFISRYNTRTKTAQRVTIQTYEGNTITERIDIKSMRWKDDVWVLESGYKRHFSNGAEDAVPFKNEIDKHLNFTPAQLAEKRANPEDMSYSELKNFIDEIVRNGGDTRKWQVDLNFKLSAPFASFILVLFGAPLASSKQRSGAIFGLILSAVIFLIYFGLLRFVQTLGQLGKLPPLTAAWLTNVIFLCLGLVVLIKAKK